eukprot:358030-Chlamydomonas_euryale.AAC.1
MLANRAPGLAASNDASTPLLSPSSVALAVRRRGDAAACSAAGPESASGGWAEGPSAPPLAAPLTPKPPSATLGGGQTLLAAEVADGEAEVSASKAEVVTGAAEVTEGAAEVAGAAVEVTDGATGDPEGRTVSAAWLPPPSPLPPPLSPMVWGV